MVVCTEGVRRGVDFFCCITLKYLLGPQRQKVLTPALVMQSAFRVSTIPFDRSQLISCRIVMMWAID